MKATITHRVDVANVQKLTALRDQQAAALNEDPDVTVIHSGSAQDSQTYEVRGVDLITEQVFTEEVEAQAADEAMDMVQGSGRVPVIATEAHS